MDDCNDPECEGRPQHFHVGPIRWPEEGTAPGPYLVFDATLPPEATMPIKPTRDTTLANGSVLRRVRVWLDGYLDPGATEKFLLLDGETFEVTVRRKGKVPPG